MSFEDHEHYKTWLRFKEAAGEEKQWMHQRLGWMMTAQGVLLAIYSFSNRSDTIDADFDKILKLLPFAGLVITLIGFIGVLAAAQMHLRWTFNLNKIEADVSSRSILTFGSKPHWAAQSSSLLPPTLSYFLGLA